MSYHEAVTIALGHHQKFPSMDFDAARHIRYFQRCYKSILPHHYTANDSNRLALGYFIVAGLDVLSSPSSYTSDPDASSAPPVLLAPADKAKVRKWVLSLQHRSGGFCGSPQHVFPAEIVRGYNGENKIPAADDTENANVAATYFALMLLGILADGTDAGARETYREVNRVATLKWLKRLQRSDGSFGEIVKADGTIGGGRDMRYCYMAATIRWVLSGHDDPPLDFDVDSFVAHIRRSQAFDGGIAESAMGESHAGYAYCAVAALSTLDFTAQDGENPTKYLEAGIADVPALVHYLVSRQFAYTGQVDEDEEGADDATANGASVPDIASLTIEDISSSGFSGRLNKVPDTCYTWWVSGALNILGEVFDGPTTVDRATGREFLLQKTQHMIGGFGKHAGKPPDVYHSFLGLAALATMAGNEREKGLGLFDVRLCIGREAASRVTKGREQLASRTLLDKEG